MKDVGIHSGVQRSRMTEVISRFLERKPGYSGNLMTDGVHLFSYMVVIGEWSGKTVRLPNAGKFYSRTTSRHRNMLEDMAKSKGITVQIEQ